MKKRTATAEQKAAAEARRARFAELAKAVGAMSDDERGAIVGRCGGVVNCEGRVLSVYNSCLLLTQLPTASMVGGFHQWKRCGRSVKKGAKGLALYIPMGRKGDAEGGPADASHGGEPIADAKEGGKVRFIMGTVFDVSQTQPTEDAAPIECRQCGCVSDTPGRCEVCGAVMVGAPVAVGDEAEEVETA